MKNDVFWTIRFNSIIYSNDFIGKIDFSTDFLANLGLFVKKDKQYHFIDSRIKEKLYYIINDFRFKEWDSCELKLVYELCNEMIIYLNSLGNDGVLDECRWFYFNQVVCRDYDHFFCNGDAFYYADLARDYIYSSLEYDFDVYLALNSKNCVDSNVFKDILSFKPVSLNSIDKFTYSVRALRYFYGFDFCSEVILDNIKLFLDYELFLLRKFCNSCFDSWYEELECDSRTLVKILDINKG